VGPSNPGRREADGPLGRCILGPNFLDTLTSTPGVDRSKVVDVIVEIVTSMGARDCRQGTAPAADRHRR